MNVEMLLRRQQLFKSVLNAARIGTQGEAQARLPVAFGELGNCVQDALEPLWNVRSNDGFLKGGGLV